MDLIEEMLKYLEGEGAKILTQREVTVMKMRFGLDDGKPKSLEEIGNRFDVARERVRQIEATALKKLKTANTLSELKKEDEEVDMEILAQREKQVKRVLSYDMGADLHEAWRETRKREDGTYEPRMKKSKDEEWNKTHGTDDVDIANLTFEELPSNWQYENLAAARVAINQTYSYAMGEGEITEEQIEDMSSAVHEAWLKRNDWVYDEEYGNPDQAKPYEELSEEEKAKDRAQIIQAIEKVKAFKRGEIDIDKLSQQYGLEKSDGAR